MHSIDYLYILSISGSIIYSWIVVSLYTNHINIYSIYNNDFVPMSLLPMVIGESELS